MAWNLSDIPVIGNIFGNNKPKTASAPTLTPEQQAYYSKTASMYGGIMDRTKQQLSDAYSDMVSGRGRDMTNYWQNSVYNPAMRIFQQYTLPGIQEVANKAGLGRSTYLQGMQQRGYENMNQSALDKLYQMQETEDQNAIARRTQGLQMLHQMNQGMIQPGQGENMAYQDPSAMNQLMGLGGIAAIVKFILGK